MPLTPPQVSKRTAPFRTRKIGTVRVTQTHRVGTVRNIQAKHPHTEWMEDNSFLSVQQKRKGFSILLEKINEHHLRGDARHHEMDHARASIAFQKAMGMRVNANSILSYLIEEIMDGLNPYVRKRWADLHGENLKNHSLSKYYQEFREARSFRKGTGVTLPVAILSAFPDPIRARWLINERLKEPRIQLALRRLNEVRTIEMVPDASLSSQSVRDIRFILRVLSRESRRDR